EYFCCLYYSGAWVF
nr:immunoglobulin light chain junction region [Macaca mulatta]